jgi:hypothetical protein
VQQSPITSVADFRRHRFTCVARGCAMAVETTVLEFSQKRNPPQGLLSWRLGEQYIWLRD